MNKTGRLTKRNFCSICEKHGFTKKYNNLYRCHGHGLLQVISHFGRDATASGSPRNVDVAFGVFSLYSELSWIPTHISTIVGYHLPAIYEVTSTVSPGNRITLPADETQIMLSAGLPFLDQMVSNAQLIDFLERYDLEFGSQIIKNDANKIAPYIISNQLEKAADCIDAIEQQNWDAHQANSRQISGYDVDSHKKRIEARLSSYLVLRDAIHNDDAATIEKHLWANYSKNITQLKRLGIPIDESCVAPNLSHPYPYAE